MLILDIGEKCMSIMFWLLNALLAVGLFHYLIVVINKSQELLNKK